MNPNYIDVILGGLICYGAFKGFRKGLMSELASVVALVIGIYGAIYASDITYKYLSQFTDWGDNTINTLSYIITFIIIVIAIIYAGKFLTKIISLVSLGLINRTLGCLLGGAKNVLIIGILLTFFNKINMITNLVSQETLAESKLYFELIELCSTLFESISIEEYNFFDFNSNKPI